MVDTNSNFNSEEARKSVFKYTVPLLNPNISKDEIVKGYKEWAENSDYDKDLGAGGYQGPSLTAQYFADGYPIEKRPDAKILDVGAGTGLVARALREQGFCHIDALDPSEEMMNVARKDELYEHYFCEFLAEKQLPIESNTYDGVTAAGCFCAGHIPCAALHEVIRIVKPGGIIVIVTRIDYLETCPDFKGQLEPLMEKLEAEGKWKKLKRDVGAMYYLDKEAVCYKYEVLADTK